MYLPYSHGLCDYRDYTAFEKTFCTSRHENTQKNFGCIESLYQDL